VNPSSQSLTIPLDRVIELAVEHWRLSGWLASVASRADVALARHALRKMEGFLGQFQIEARSLDGLPFDPGLPVTVIDAVDDPKRKEGEIVIVETLSPLVMWRGQVVKSAEVVTSRGTRKK
jgi:hypothetical protein